MTVEFKKSCVRESYCSEVKECIFRISVKPKSYRFLWALSGPFLCFLLELYLSGIWFHVLRGECGECVVNRHYWPIPSVLLILGCCLGPHQGTAGSLILLISVEWLDRGGCLGASSVCAQSCLTLCDPMDYSLPGSSVHGIL